ncbi:Transcription elongation factor spt6, partial [Rhizophlyctis rosea]
MSDRSDAEGDNPPSSPPPDSRNDRPSSRSPSPSRNDDPMETDDRNEPVDNGRRDDDAGADNSSPRRGDNNEEEGELGSEEEEVRRKPTKKKKKKRRDGDDDEDEESGEDVSRPSKKRHGMYSDESDDDEEEEEEEMTEADLKFIVDDEDEEEEDDQEEIDEDEPGSDAERRRKDKKRRKKKKKKRKRRESDSEDLDEDDLDLMEENRGTKKFKRLRRRVDDEEEDEEERLAKQFFSDEEAGPSKKRDVDFDERELYEDEDDLGDFVIDDDEGEVSKEVMVARKQERKAMVKNLAKDSGVDDRTWREWNDLFDCSEYDFALYDPDSKQGKAALAEHWGAEEVPDEVETVTRKHKELKLTDVYEPSEIAAKMMTEEDDRIRSTDLPERFQTRPNFIPLDKDNLSPEDLAQLDAEAIYIVRHMLSEKSISFVEPLGVDNKYVQITRKILTFMRVEHHEVPFIDAHRQDYYRPTLERADLWRIYDLDAQFLLIDAKKKAARAMFEDIRETSRLAREDGYVLEMLNSAVTAEDVEDVHVYMQIRYGKEVQEAEQRKRTQKRARRKSAYEEAKSFKFDELAGLFNIDVPTFARSVATHIPEHFPDDHHDYPIDAARTYTRMVAPFKEEQKVLEAAKTIVATEIAADPVFRRHVRRLFLGDSAVTVTPTLRGRTEIDQGHPYYPFKYLTNKPVYHFKDTQFASIIRAEEEGLVTISVQIEEHAQFMEDCYKNIKNDHYSDIADSWNQERKAIVDRATKDILFPQATKWVKEMLANDAQDRLAAECFAALGNKIDMQPFKPDHRHSEDEEVIYDDAPRVMAMSWGDGEKNDHTVCVMLDENGVVIDRLRLDNLQFHSIARGQDLNLLTQFLNKNRPEFIAIGGFKPNTHTGLLRLIREHVKQAYADRKLKDDIPVEVVEDDVARIYMSSKRGQKEYPGGEAWMLVRYCVSLGRKCQDPLLEYAGLMNHDDDVLQLNLHPRQRLLPKDKLKGAIERQFINVTNSTHTVQPKSRLENRRDIVHQNLSSGPNMFANCLSFLRIRTKHLQSAFGHVDPSYDILDDTRIHLEDYELARQMAADVLEIDRDMYEEDENPSHHVAELMEGDQGRLNELNELMLDDYAYQLEKRLGEPKQLTLEHTRQELLEPYKDRRARFNPGTPDEIFTMLTGETEETFYEGLLTSGEVTKILEKAVRLRLPNGLEGFVPAIRTSVPRERDSVRGEIPMNLMNFNLYKVDQAYEARVVRIEKDRMQVEMDLKNVHGDQMRGMPKDQYFSDSREKDDLIDVKQTVQPMKKKRQNRQLDHPFFQDIDYKAATEYLTNKPWGTVVIRPSTKGKDHWSLSWKPVEGAYYHLDIKEVKHMDGTKKYQIENTDYSEIDELLATHIEPMNLFIQKMMTHPKFHRQSEEEYRGDVISQCERDNRTIYGFVMVQNKAGVFHLIWMHPGSRLDRAAVVVKPTGYHFSTDNKTYTNVEDLVMAFKRNEMKKAEEEQRRKKAAAAGGR